MHIQFEMLPTPTDARDHNALVNVVRILNLALRKVDYEPIEGAGERSSVSWKSDWAVGNYYAHSMVKHNGVLYISNKATAEEPSELADDWDDLP